MGLFYGRGTVWVSMKSCRPSRSPFAAVAGMLHAAERSLCSRTRACVETHVAEAQAGDDSRGSLFIRGEHVCGQTIFGLVCGFDDFMLIGELNDGYDGSECLFVDADHVGRRATQHSRRKEASLLVVADNAGVVVGLLCRSVEPPSSDDFAPLVVASSTCRCTLSKALRSISGPMSTPSAMPLPTFMAFTRSASLSANCVDHSLLHVQPIGTDAGLPCSAEFVGHQLFDCSIEIGILKHDERRVAAEFQGQSLQVRCRGGSQFFPDGCRTGETDHSHGRMFAELSLISPAGPRTRLTLPAGRSSCSISENSATIDSGVFDDGLMTQAQSAASAAENFLASIANGKFQGVISAATPAGR